MKTDDGHLSDEAIAELAAFADGSLAPADHERVAKAVAESPELQAIVERQTAAIRASAGIDAVAPSDLHLRIQDQLPSTNRDEPATRARWLDRLPRIARPKLAGGFAVAVLTAVIAAFALTGPASPTVAQTSALAERGASSPAPAVDPADPGTLVASVGGVDFPNYENKFDWVQSGQRSDELEGRGSRTVFYEQGEKKVAYSIVDGDPLEWPEDATSTERDGVKFFSLEYDGRNVVTWLRGGHTCVLSSSELDTAELIRLAAWESDPSTV